MAFSNDYQVMDIGRYNVTAVNIGGFNASGQKPLFCVPPSTIGVKGVSIVDIVLVSDTASESSSSSAQFAFQVTDKTNDLDLLSSAVETDGNEIGEDTAFHIIPDENNLNLGKDTVLELDITKTGTPTDLSSAEVTAYVLWRWEI